MRQFVIQIIEFHIVIAYKAMHALAYHTQTFLDNFLERAADRHDFAHRLHARTDFARHTRKLSQVPTGNFTNQVIQLRSLVSGIRSTHFADLVERIAQCNLGGNESERITGGFGRQCGGTGQTGVHLDYAIVVGLGVERILDVTFAHDAEVTDTFGRKFLQHFHLFVGKRAGWSNHDRLTGMNAQRVEVFHACHGEAVVVGVADYLEFDFLPAFQGFFHQNLLGERERTFSQLDKRFLVRTDTTAQAAQSVCRTHHYRIADFAGSLQGVFHAFHGVALRSFHRNLIQLLHKEIAVFRIHDSLYRSTQYTYAVFLQSTVQVKFRTAVQRSLSAESQQDTVRLLFLNDFFYEIRSYRQEVNFIGNTFRRLDCSNIRVNQYRTHTFFAQSLQSLRAGIVKLPGLTDLERT